MERNMGTNSIKILDIVQVSLMAAIICVATMFIKFPNQIGYTHIGDSMVFVAAILFGKKKGAAASAIGMMFADILTGYAVWAPFTFVIKGIMGFIVGSIAYRKNYEGKNLMNNTFAFVIAGIWMILAYYLANIVMAKYIVFEAATLHESQMIALAGIPGNCIQAVVGMVLALPLSKILKEKIK
ncbi:ECF transporter S component [Haloimpatiens sp. FM7330]|uniref:ECF transporter S component n=1 Tax=Haloimpatiens sp. FM7330 TaxID=3298610 RepID=UPI00363C5CD9